MPTTAARGSCAQPPRRAGFHPLPTAIEQAYAPPVDNSRRDYLSDEAAAELIVASVEVVVRQLPASSPFRSSLVDWLAVLDAAPRRPALRVVRAPQD